MKSTYTRDVDPKMMDFCKDDKVFGKFVEFVKQHDDLALCFRGNDSEMGTVTIYRHNHMMWQLKIDMYGCSVVGLSMDHCRFMADWDTYAIKGLMEIGFKPTNDEYRDYDYDALELAQPSKPGVKLGESNKPDMFGIRFDSEGNMKAISLIEVKSTEEAFSGKSGVKKHMQGMLEYIKDHNGELILDRKKEAYRILNQYRELGMYGLDNNIDEFKENDFLNLEVEIIFVFSHGYTVKSYIEKEKSTVASLLKKSIDSQSFFRVGRREDYSNKIDFSVETKYLAAYRYPIKK